jgi:hypothetical protein
MLQPSPRETVKGRKHVLAMLAAHLLKDRLRTIVEDHHPGAPAFDEVRR